MVSTTLIKELRERTGAGVMDAKRALEETGADLERAAELLRQRGLAAAAKRAARVANQGLVEAYIHAGGRIGSMVEVNCETDFVARTDEFKQLAHDLAMQVAAASPKYVAAADVPADESDPVEQVALLEQPFIRDPGRQVKDIVHDVVARLGENVQVRRFARFELGGA